MKKKKQVAKSAAKESDSRELAAEELEQVSGGGGFPKMIMAIPGDGSFSSGLGAGGQGVPAASPAGSPSQGGNPGVDALDKAADAYSQILSSVTKLF